MLRLCNAKLCVQAARGIHNTTGACTLMIPFLSICAMVMPRIPSSSTKDPQCWTQDRLWSWRCSRFRVVFSALPPARAPASKGQWEWRWTVEWRWCLDHGSGDSTWWNMKSMWIGRVGAGSPVWKQAEAKGSDAMSYLLYHRVMLSSKASLPAAHGAAVPRAMPIAPHSCSSAAQMPTKPPAASLSSAAAVSHTSLSCLLSYSPFRPCKAKVGSPVLAAWLPSHPPGCCSSMAGQGLTAGLEVAQQHCQQMPIIEEDSRDYALQAVISKKAERQKKKKKPGTCNLVFLTCW